MCKVIKVTESGCVVRRQILILEVSVGITKEGIQLLRNRITDQMKSGLVILPPGIRAITCDKDMVIKIKEDCDSPYLDEWIDVTEEVINEQRKRKEAAANQTDPIRSQGFDDEGLWSDPVRM